MKTFIASLLLLVLPEVIDIPNPLFLHDKVKVQGTVIDADTQQPLVGATIQIKAMSIGETSDANGYFEFYTEPGTYLIEVLYVGFKKYSTEITVPKTGLSNLVISLDPEVTALDEVVMSGRPAMQKQSNVATSYAILPPPRLRDYNTEEYAEISENTFKWATKTPLSTFSIDVDGASYSNVRRMIMDGRLPVKDAVRVEELINYFNYDYEDPVGEHPFSVNTEKKLKQIIFLQVT
jgi:Ca-activated chloride channel family protein